MRSSIDEGCKSFDRLWLLHDNGGTLDGRLELLKNMERLYHIFRLL